MTFIHTWPPIVAAALAILLVILWLLKRLLLPQVTFPPFVWLLSVRRASSPLRRLRPHLNVFLAVTSLLLLGLLFGRPVIGRGPGGSRAVAIILDASLSMAACEPDSIFRRAKRRASDVLSTVAAGDLVNLAVAGTDVTWAYTRAPLGHDVDPVWRLLENAAVTCGTGHLDQAVGEAVARLDRAGIRKKELYVISDFQEEGWRTVPFPPFAGVDVFPLRLEAQSRDNIAVQCPERSVYVCFPGEPVEVRVRIRNFGTKAERGELAWRIGDREIERTAVRLPAGGMTRLSRAFTFSDAGTYEGTCEVVVADALRQDNRAHFSCEVRRQARVGVASSDTTIRTLLGAAIGNGLASVPVTSEPATEARSGFDTIVASGAASNEFSEAFRSGTGGVLFLGPSSPVPAGLDLELSAEEGSFALQSAFRGHSTTEIPALAGVVVRGRRLGLEHGDVLVRFADGVPAIVRLGEMNVIIALFDLGFRERDLLGNEEAAVVLLGELVRLALAAPSAAFVAGKPQEVLLPQAGYRFFSPSNLEIFPSSTAVGSQARISFPPPRELGFIKIWRDGRLVRSMPVNTPAGESDIAFGGPRYRRWQEAGRGVGESRQREATRFVLALLFLLHGVWLSVALTGREEGRHEL